MKIGEHSDAQPREIGMPMRDREPIMTCRERGWLEREGPDGKAGHYGKQQAGNGSDTLQCRNHSLTAKRFRESRRDRQTRTPKYFSQPAAIRWDIDHLNPPLA
jgi:hypothetical protein